MLNFSVNHLIEYTDWERQRWHEWLCQHGDDALKMSAGPNGDGRFKTMGDLIGHIFSAEKFYVERLSGRALTNLPSIPNDSIEALFQFGARSRKDLNTLLESFPEGQWEVPNEHKIRIYSITATPRKIVMHVLFHEIRHWAQIATLFRLNGLTVDAHDFLVGPVMGGEVKREQVKT
jgi:uncharacterized damage-inducible protein DinB